MRGREVDARRARENRRLCKFCKSDYLMRVGNPMLDSIFSEKPECGARTRSGDPCRQNPMRNGRCRMHGGASPAGRKHWNYKHGQWTKGAIALRRSMALVRKQRKARMNLLLAAYEKLLAGDPRVFNALCR